MAETPSGLNPTDIHSRRESSLAYLAALASVAVPVLEMAKEAVKSFPEYASNFSHRLFIAETVDLNLPIAAALIVISRESNLKASRLWTGLALAEGLVGTAGHILLRAGIATGRQEMITAGGILSIGSYGTEIMQAATMHYQMNIDPGRSRITPSPTLPLATL